MTTPAAQPMATTPPAARRLLLVGAPNTQDRLNLAALAAEFARHGFQTEIWLGSSPVTPTLAPNTPSTPDSLKDAVARSNFALISDRLAPELQGFVLGLRMGARQTVPIRLVSERPAQMGQDLRASVGGAPWPGVSWGQAAAVVLGALGETRIAGVLQATKRLPRPPHTLPEPWPPVTELPPLAGGGEDERYFRRVGTEYLRERRYLQAIHFGTAEEVVEAIRGFPRHQDDHHRSLLVMHAVLYLDEARAAAIPRDVWQSFVPRERDHFGLLAACVARGGVLRDHLPVQFEQFIASIEDRRTPTSLLDSAHILASRRRGQAAPPDLAMVRGTMLDNDVDLALLLAGDVNLGDPLEEDVTLASVAEPAYWVSGLPHWALPELIARTAERVAGQAWVTRQAAKVLTGVIALTPPRTPEEFDLWGQLVRRCRLKSLREIIFAGMRTWPMLTEQVAAPMLAHADAQANGDYDKALQREIIEMRLPPGPLRERLTTARVAGARTPIPRVS